VDRPLGGRRASALLKPRAWGEKKGEKASRPRSNESSRSLNLSSRGASSPVIFGRSAWFVVQKTREGGGGGGKGGGGRSVGTPIIARGRVSSFLFRRKKKKSGAAPGFSRRGEGDHVAARVTGLAQGRGKKKLRFCWSLIRPGREKGKEKERSLQRGESQAVVQ